MSMTQQLILIQQTLETVADVYYADFLKAGNSYMEALMLLLLILQYNLQQMSYNKNCLFQDCIERCCNIFGACPLLFTQEYSQQIGKYGCYYYYGQEPQLVYATISAILGAVFLVLLVIVIQLACCLKRRQSEVNAAGISLNPTQNNSNNSQNIIYNRDNPNLPPVLNKKTPSSYPQEEDDEQVDDAANKKQKNAEQSERYPQMQNNALQVVNACIQQG